jgi:hypothetical protein
MKNNTNKIIIAALIIAVLYVGLTYTKKVITGQSLMINIKNLDLSNIQQPKIIVDITNPTTTPVTLQAIFGEINNNKTPFANISYNQNVTFQGLEKKTIAIVLDVNILGLLPLLRSIGQNKLSFDMTGTITAENVSFPFTKQFTA